MKNLENTDNKNENLNSVALSTTKDKKMNRSNNMVSYILIFIVFIIVVIAGIFIKNNFLKSITDCAIDDEATGYIYSGYVDLGLQFLNTEEYERAMEYFNRALTYKDNDPIVYNNICVIDILTDQCQEAFINCDKAINLDPSVELFRNNRIWAGSACSEGLDDGLQLKIPNN